MRVPCYIVVLPLLLVMIIDSHIPANSICISIYTVQQISYHFTILTIALVEEIAGKNDIMYIGFIVALERVLQEVLLKLVSY